MSIRLNKLLAGRGIASRRRCDEIIAEGRVRVNGRVVNEVGTTVEEGRDRVEVDGRPLPGRQRNVYYVLNKPVGVITTLDDPQGRRSVRELLPRGARVYPVGRLDADTSGLLLLTNDGELAHRLMHPRYGVVKVYRARLEREPSRSALERLARGVEFEPGVVSAPAKVRRIDPGFDAIMIEVQIHEGRFRQVRRMCEAVGLHVTGLHRVGYGPIRLGPLARGLFRELSEDEVERLRAASARPGGTGQRRSQGAASRPARSARPARPIPPAVESEDAADEIGETWIPGGGFTSEFQDDESGAGPEWPARAGGRRGDDDFAGAPTPRAKRPSGRAPERPAQRSERVPSRGPRRDERGPRGRSEPPRGRSAAPRSRSEAPRGRFEAQRTERAPARGSRRDERGPRGRSEPPRGRSAAPRSRFEAQRSERAPARGSRRDERVPRGRSEPPRGRFGPGRERFERPSRGERGAASSQRRGEGPAVRGPRRDDRSPARGPGREGRRFDRPAVRQGRAADVGTRRAGPAVRGERAGGPRGLSPERRPRAGSGRQRRSGTGGRASRGPVANRSGNRRGTNRPR